MGGILSLFDDKNTIISAVANLSTAYNLTIISYALVIANGTYDDNEYQTAVKTAALVGAIAGQLTFGYVGDCLGRSKAMFLTMLLSLGGAILGSISSEAGHTTPYPWLIASRAILGIGVGGVYPLAATVAAESSKSNADRGRQVSAVFSTQGIGFLLCPLMIMLCTAFAPSDSCPGDTNFQDGLCIGGADVCGDKHSGLNGCLWNDNTQTCADGSLKLGKGCNDASWRIALALGALPGLLLLPFRARETGKAKFKSNGSFFADLADRRHWWTLCGTAGGWFLFDITFYGNSLFAPKVLQFVFQGGDKDNKGTIITQMGHNAAVFAIALPGYWVATYFMDTWGRKNIQRFGFFMMFITYGLLALLLGYDGHKGDDVTHQKALLLILYGLTFFFSNFGPNSTTFILPSESFPSEVRTSLNGFSAACGKTGAAIGSAIFKPLSDHIGTPWVLGICAFISLLGLVVTHIFVEDRRGMGMKGDDDDALMSNEFGSTGGDALLVEEGAGAVPSTRS
eukprot:g1566.t1